MSASPMRRPSSAQGPAVRSAKSAQGEEVGADGFAPPTVQALGLGAGIWPDALSLLASRTSTFPFVAALEESSSTARCTSSAWQDSCVSAKACAAGSVEGGGARIDAVGDDLSFVVGPVGAGSAHSVRESSSRNPSSRPQRLEHPPAGPWRGPRSVRGEAQEGGAEGESCRGQGGDGTGQSSLRALLRAKRARAIGD